MTSSLEEKQQNIEKRRAQLDAQKNQISASVYIIALKVNDQTQFIRLVEGSGK